LLVTLLAKLTNFVPEAGIWMNTQRPEWNDANNALVGAGASMVTVYYLRRFLVFGIKLFQADQTKAVPISTEVIALFAAIQNTFQEHQNLLTRSMTNIERKTILDQLGSAGSDYRKKIYADGFSETKKTLAIADLVAFFQLALQFVDHSIQANHRQDKLHHAYNLIKINRDGGISIRHLYEMLEGQVAVLSSGFLAPEAALALLDSLRHSALYREDQGSYILYPDRQLPRFIDKNNIPPVELDKSRLLKGLAAAGDKQIIIQESQSGAVHFNGDLRNARILQEALAKLKQQERWQRLVEAEEQLILNLYESLFDHQSFTGRSGTFYKYEGLGCIYWHMVAKLLLAVQENYYWALKSGANKSLLEQLKAHYYDIREGIGVHKSPMQYGAFPTDPYSHTPGFAGVQQPGMTGQVKEDILSRFGELGIEVQDGKLSFNLHLLKRSEFLAGPQLFQYYDVNGKLQQLELSTGMIAFTICQVPIIYILAEKSKIIVTKSNGTEEEKAGLELDTNLSAAIFKRTDSVKQIWVYIEP